MSRETIQMALRALKAAEALLPVNYKRKWIGIEAIAALEQELAKPTNEFHPDWDTLKPYHDRIAELEAQLVKTEYSDLRKAAEMALEALEMHVLGFDGVRKMELAIEALESALAKPDETETLKRCLFQMQEAAKALAQPEQALDKKADNARELGLDYEPEQESGKCNCGANLYIDETGKPCSKAQPEQWTPVEIGVDVTPEGTHVVGMYVLMPDVVRHVFYSQFHPAPVSKPDTRLKVKLGRQYGFDLNGHWFYLQPADEYAEAALSKHSGISATPSKPEQDHGFDRTASHMAGEYVDIAQPERNFCQRCGKRLGDGIHTCTPTEQEPVAFEIFPLNFANETRLQYKKPEQLPAYLSYRPLFAAPPKREWVGLTDDELDQCDAHETWRSMKNVEAKLKEKNT